MPPDPLFIIRSTDGGGAGTRKILAEVQVVSLTDSTQEIAELRGLRPDKGRHESAALCEITRGWFRLNGLVFLRVRLFCCCSA
jgi:hypothetical protein